MRQILQLFVQIYILLGKTFFLKTQKNNTEHRTQNTDSEHRTQTQVSVLILPPVRAWDPILPLDEQVEIVSNLAVGDAKCKQRERRIRHFVENCVLRMVSQK